MKEFHVTCINKPNRESNHEQITRVGNIAGGWKMTRQVANERLESKKESFCAVDPTAGRRASIGVVRDPGKAQYLRTHADAKWNNNLRSLEECRSACSVVS